MPNKPALIIGDACVDLIIQVPEKSGNAQYNAPPVLHGGGTGANTAGALARLGQPTSFMGTIGDDGYGRFTVGTLEAEGIDTSHITVASEAFTVQILALIDQAGERTLFGWPRRGGAQAKLQPDAITPEVIEQMAWVHTTGICLVESPSREAVLRAMALAQAVGIPVSFDINLRLGFEEGKLPKPFLATIQQAIQLSDFVFGSDTDEIAHLTPGLSPEAGGRVLSEGKRTILIRLGDAGTLVISPNSEIARIPAFQVEVVDTLGAGDVFNGGFIAAKLAGESLSDAVRWGWAFHMWYRSIHARHPAYLVST
ncbi:MAG: sugar kinase [Chloroflexota bacterium]